MKMILKKTSEEWGETHSQLPSLRPSGNGRAAALENLLWAATTVLSKTSTPETKGLACGKNALVGSSPLAGLGC